MIPASARYKGLSYGLNTPFTSNLTDLTGKTWTAYGGAAVSGGSLLLDGTGDYLDTPYHADHNFTSGQDVTIRFKVKVNTFASGVKQLLGNRYEAGGGAVGWVIYTNTSNVVTLNIFRGNSVDSIAVATASGSYSFGTEFEVSFERKGMVWYAYINGTQSGSSVSQPWDYFVNTNCKVTLGSDVNAAGGSGRDLNGTMRNVQIVKGRAMGNGGGTTPLI